MVVGTLNGQHRDGGGGQEKRGRECCKGWFEEEILCQGIDRGAAGATHLGGELENNIYFSRVTLT